jgi:hypothetical protein
MAWALPFMYSFSQGGHDTMKSANKAKPILTARDEAILRTIWKYRYMTALDVTKLLFSNGSHIYNRDNLTSLAGGEDLHTNAYLCRFSLPSSKIGNPERIYTLGVKGRNFLARDIGLPVNWYFRPYKLKHLSYSTVLHNLILTRFLVASQICKEMNVSEIQLCYELANAPGRVELGLPAGGKEKKVTVAVIPDAWLDFERVADGKRFPVILEIDRGMEYSRKFKQHVRSRIAFIESGQYKQVFGRQAVRVVYITTGETPEYRETRRKAMTTWTCEVLAEKKMENWSSLFYFGSLVFEEIYDTGFFTDALWFRPDLKEPIGLFAS